MANWQAAQPGTVVGDGQGNYQIRVSGQWQPMPKGSLIADEHGAYHFDSDVIKPPKAPAEAVPGNIKSAQAAAPAASAPDATGAANNAANKAEDAENDPVHQALNSLKAIPSGVLPSLRGFLQSLGNENIHPDAGTHIVENAKSLLDTISHPTQTLTSVGSTLENATPEQVGKNVLAPIVTGMGASKVGAALGPSEAAAAEAASPAGQIGLRSTEGKPLSTFAAGSSAGPVLDVQNNGVALRAMGNEVGVPNDQPVNHQTLPIAAGPPGQVLDAGTAALPTTTLSPAAIAKIRAARGPERITKGTPNVEGQINDLETRLLAPDQQFSGAQIRNERNSLNSDANAGATSDDADTRAMAKYKRNIVDALDQHIADTMPANSAISPEMIANARATLAKNYSLRDLITKGGDVDLQALAKDHRDNPNKYTGVFRTVAQFAHDHPEVTGSISDATRIAPPSFLHDVGSINPIKPISSLTQAVFGAMGRRGLRGPAGAAMDAAKETPVAGLGGEFTPRDTTPQPPPGLTASPPTGVRPPPAGPPGQIPYSHVLSEGVEQSPSPGLSAGPMGAPAPTGIPFAQNAGHMAGGLELSPEQWLQHFMENNSDVPKVASQGVPEDIVARTAQNPGLKMPVAHSPAFVNNNASAESAASLEAQKRPKGNFVEYNGDTASPILKDVTQADHLTPSRGHIVLDADTGKLVSSGGMAPALVRGLLARWQALHKPLGESY